MLFTNCMFLYAMEKEVKIMPGGDRTGPAGRGPMTGRGAGLCAGYGAAGFSTPGLGAGRTAFGGRGCRGRRNRFFATGVPGWQDPTGQPIAGGMSFPRREPAPRDEMDVLKEQAQSLEKGLQELQARMDALASRDNKTE
jgi:hypothetical protein